MPKNPTGIFVLHYSFIVCFQTTNMDPPKCYDVTTSVHLDNNNNYKINCLTHSLDFYLGHPRNQKRVFNSRSELDPYPRLNGEWTKVCRVD